MNNKPNNTDELLRRALASQIDLGTSEVVISRKSQKRRESDLQTISNSNSAVASELTLEIETGTSGVSEYDSLDSHYQAICNCMNCPLGKTRNKFVYGVGNPNADLVFIGEGPGAEEDKQGEPFVGRAGKLLDKILEAINLNRQQIYIANMVKCRPPGNRDPQPEEMEACNEYLLEQLRIIKPKIICALGRVAAQGLLKSTIPVGKLRGIWHDFHGMQALVTYHPAALLRNPAFKRGTWEDMKMLRARYDELTK